MRHAQLKNTFLRKKDLPTGPCYDEESWEEDFFDEVGHMQKSKKQKENEHEQEDSDSDKDIEEICTPVPKICTLSEAMSSLEDIQQFLDHQGYTSEATEACHLLDKLAMLQQKRKLNTLKQATIRPGGAAQAAQAMG